MVTKSYACATQGAATTTLFLELQTARELDPHSSSNSLYLRAGGRGCQPVGRLLVPEYQHSKKVLGVTACDGLKYDHAWILSTENLCVYISLRLG